MVAAKGVKERRWTPSGGGVKEMKQESIKEQENVQVLWKKGIEEVDREKDEHKKEE